MKSNVRRYLYLGTIFFDNIKELRVYPCSSDCEKVLIQSVMFELLPCGGSKRPVRKSDYESLGVRFSIDDRERRYFTYDFTSGIIMYPGWSINVEIDRLVKKRQLLAVTFHALRYFRQPP